LLCVLGGETMTKHFCKRVEGGGGGFFSCFLSFFPLGPRFLPCFWPWPFLYMGHGDEACHGEPKTKTQNYHRNKWGSSREGGSGCVAFFLSFPFSAPCTAPTRAIDHKETTTPQCIGPVIG
jgi:hypothetical protein